MASCTFPPLAESMTFENFKRYDAVETAFKTAKEIADNPGELIWLALLGASGTGKTHLGVAICKAWINRGIAARYAFTSLLLEELREGFNQDKGKDSYFQRWSYYCNVPLLLLDDYGTESRTPWVQEKLDALIDYRLMNNKSLIITSNNSLDEMPGRVKSRLIRHPRKQIVAIIADDYALRGK